MTKAKHLFVNSRSRRIEGRDNGFPMCRVSATAEAMGDVARDGLRCTSERYREGYETCAAKWSTTRARRVSPIPLEEV